jgi:hypothetical protein
VNQHKYIVTFYIDTDYEAPFTGSAPWPVDGEQQGAPWKWIREVVDLNPDHYDHKSTKWCISVAKVSG